MGRIIIRHPVTKKIYRNVPDTTPQGEIQRILDEAAQLMEDAVVQAVEGEIQEPAASEDEQTLTRLSPVESVGHLVGTVPTPPATPFELAQLKQDVVQVRDALLGLAAEIQATNPNRAEIKFATKDRWRRLLEIHTNELTRALGAVEKLAS